MRATAAAITAGTIDHQCGNLGRPGRGNAHQRNLLRSRTALGAARRRYAALPSDADVTTFEENRSWGSAGWPSCARRCPWPRPGLAALLGNFERVSAGFSAPPPFPRNSRAGLSKPLMLKASSFRFLSLLAAPQSRSPHGPARLPSNLLKELALFSPRDPLAPLGPRPPAGGRPPAPVQPGRGKHNPATHGNRPAVQCRVEQLLDPRHRRRPNPHGG
jgi:hypothetical protein